MFQARQFGLLVAFSAVMVTQTSAQDRPAGAGGFWQKFDKNSDGLLDPDEIPPGMKGIVQKSAEKAGLDVTKPISIEALLGGGKSTSAAPSASTSDQKPSAEADTKPAANASSPPTDASNSAPAGSAPPPTPATKPPAKTLRRFLTAHERLPSGLPSWFVQSDRDKDAQVMMHEFTIEWSDRKAAEFASYDRNGDGVITAKEALGQPISPPPRAVSPPPTAAVMQQTAKTEGSPTVSNAVEARPGPPTGSDNRANTFRGSRNREDYGNNSGRGPRDNSRPDGRRSRR